MPIRVMPVAVTVANPKAEVLRGSCLRQASESNCQQHWHE
jgi:hypothetical protein